MRFKKFPASCTPPPNGGGVETTCEMEQLVQKVLEQWDLLDLTNFIYEMYEIYHIERLENAFDDIDKLILERQR